MLPLRSRLAVFIGLIFFFYAFPGAIAAAPLAPAANVIENDKAQGIAESEAHRNRAPTTEWRESDVSSSVPHDEKSAMPEEPPLLLDHCASIHVFGETWLDQTHDYVDRKLCQPAVWFDDFFGSEYVLEDARPTMFISLKNAVRWTDGQGAEMVRDYKLLYRLPQMEKVVDKARFFITSESSADKFTVQPGQAIDPGLDPATGVRKPTVGVRLNFFRWLRSLTTVDVGIKMQLPIDPFIRMRYQYTKPLGARYLFRFNETALWRSIEHFTETSRVDFERKIATFALLRWSNYLTYLQGSRGMTWNTGASLLTQLTPKSAVSYDTSMWGGTSPLWFIENYRIGVKYRQNFYRSWLFFELEPEITWPKDVTGHRYSAAAFMATLEIQFGR